MQISKFKICTFVNVLGFVAVAVGFFSPWAVQHPSPNLYGIDQYAYVIELPLGLLAILAWFIGLLFQLLSVIGKRKYLLVVVCCGIVIAVCSVIHIRFPAFQYTVSASDYFYAALYGVYVTFAGGLIIVASSIIGFLLRHSD